MTGPADDVTRGRLVGGDLDGIVTEIEPGQDTVEMFGMGVVLGKAPQRNAHLANGNWVYRYVRTDEDLEGRVAIFEFSVDGEST